MLAKQNTLVPSFQYSTPKNESSDKARRLGIAVQGLNCAGMSSTDETMMFEDIAYYPLYIAAFFWKSWRKLLSDLSVRNSRRFLHHSLIR